MPTRIKNFVTTGLMPAHTPERAVRRPVRLPVGSIVLAGRLLGNITSVTPVSEVRLLTITGTPTGFNGTISFTHGGGTTTATLANLVTTIPTAAQMQTAFDTIFGAGNTVVTKSSLAYTITFAGILANVKVGTNDGLSGYFSSSLTFTAGSTPAGTFSVSVSGSAGVGQYDVYATGNSDGTGTAKCALIYDYKSDQRGGRVTEQGSAGQLESATAFFSGFFWCSDLLGIDADAVTDLGKLSEGTDVTNADAILKF